MQDDSITSQITSVYDPAGVETKWYQYWLDHKLFEAHVDPVSYTHLDVYKRQR